MGTMFRAKLALYFRHIKKVDAWHVSGNILQVLDFEPANSLSKESYESWVAKNQRVIDSP